MHVEITDSKTTRTHDVEQRLAAEGQGAIHLDATLFSYSGLLDRLRGINQSGTPAPAVLLKNCSQERIKHLRRMRRNKAQDLAGLTVYAFVEVLA